MQEGKNIDKPYLERRLRSSRRKGEEKATSEEREITAKRGKLRNNKRTQKEKKESMPYFHEKPLSSVLRKETKSPNGGGGPNTEGHQIPLGGILSAQREKCDSRCEIEWDLFFFLFQKKKVGGGEVFVSVKGESLHFAARKEKEELAFPEREGVRSSPPKYTRTNRKLKETRRLKDWGNFPPGR